MEEHTTEAYSRRLVLLQAQGVPAITTRHLAAASQQQSARGWRVSTAGSAAAGTLALGALQYLGRARASLLPWRERCLSLCSSIVCTIATSQRQWGHLPFNKGAVHARVHACKSRHVHRLGAQSRLLGAQTICFMTVAVASEC